MKKTLLTMLDLREVLDEADREQLRFVVCSIVARLDGLKTRARARAATLLRGAGGRSQHGAVHDEILRCCAGVLSSRRKPRRAAPPPTTPQPESTAT